jgi:hypothetical protein
MGVTNTSHPSPELCGNARKGVVEALTGEDAGEPLSRETTPNSGRKFLLLRHTIAKRQRAKLQEIKRELKSRRHDSIPEQGRWLRRVVTGHYNYYGVPSNAHSLAKFRRKVAWHWLRSLRRRSQRHRLTWERMSRIAVQWLPPARVCHPWPWDRFHATPQGKSRVR